MEHSDRISTERAWIRPPLAKREFQVSHGRTFDCYLDVMPGRRPSIERRHRLALRVAEMVFIISAAVTEVDPADKCDIGYSPAATADDN